MTNLIERLRIDYHDPTCGVYSVRLICDCTNYARREAADALEAAEAKLAQAQEQLARAVGHLKDMLKQDDGQAYQEAERFVASIEEKS